MREFYNSIINRIYSCLFRVLYSHQMVIMQMTKRKRTSKKDDDSLLNFLAGLGLGAIGASILSALSKPNCPNCNRKIERGVTVCPHCKIELEWK